MGKMFAWPNTPVKAAGMFRQWTPPLVYAATAFAMAACTLAVILLFMFIKRKRRQKKVPGKQCEPSPVTEKPRRLPVLEIANLQGIGKREEQQDAFGASQLKDYQENGLLAVLCDGIGGMNGGQMIAGHVVSELLSLFPWRESAEPVTTICNLSADVYRQFRGYGGTTLVTALIKDGSLSFWCAGDSDLFLLREGKLCALNMRQEYKNDLLIRAFEGAFPHELAFTDLQSSALSEYIGKEKVVCEQNLKPLLLKPDDTLMLCSDGVSDTLTLAQIRDAMTLPPEQCCEKLERDIITADLPEQDNYTAITIRYHGKTTEDYEDGNQENTIA